MDTYPKSLALLFCSCQHSASIRIVQYPVVPHAQRVHAASHVHLLHLSSQPLLLVTAVALLHTNRRTNSKQSEENDSYAEA